ncbi:unnamed protein product [Bursaphelenchus okinawaensis]|uniref:Uncharacterized protein n=1 Tax=Bursaphelenchus okinawaensis TaxID=465554 RepID=A0A811K5X1_9BILA|nr:unnamed protein product [Bursaphelenchus okinawaensis]CAG9091968.1 unnamed protein product [Bursaphelenchus okinawaensis]
MFGRQPQQQVEPTMFSQWPKQITQTWPTSVQNQFKPIRGSDIVVGSQVLQQIDRFSSLDQLAQTLQSTSPPLANFLSQEIIGLKNAMNQIKMKASLGTQLYVNELQKLAKEFLVSANTEYKSLDPATQLELKSAYPTLSSYLASPIGQNLLFNETVAPLGAPSILPTPYAAQQNQELQQQLLKQQQQQAAANPYQMPYQQPAYGNNMGYNYGGMNMGNGNNRRFG